MNQRRSSRHTMNRQTPTLTPTKADNVRVRNNTIRRITTMPIRNVDYFNGNLTLRDSCDGGGVYGATRDISYTRRDTCSRLLPPDTTPGCISLSGPIHIRDNRKRW
jgi:hypothetical protein